MYGRWGLEPGEWVGEVVHEPFKAKILPATPARCPVGVHPVDRVLRYVIEYCHDSLLFYLFA